MSHQVTFLWTVPRAVSTSFERMVIARGDHTVFDEPFSRHYYFGPQRQSGRYQETVSMSAIDEILDAIERAARERPVFVKDMAYQATGQLTAERLGRWTNSFLVRHPAATIPSIARVWPDFTDEETGWDALGRAADAVQEAGQDLVVVESNRLCADPESVVAAWCERVGLAFDASALSWEPGMQPDWTLWEEWHDTTSHSTGFVPLGDPPLPPGPGEPRLAEAYADAIGSYRRLAARAL